MCLPAIDYNRASDLYARRFENLPVPQYLRRESSTHFNGENGGLRHKRDRGASGGFLQFRAVEKDVVETQA